MQKIEITPTTELNVDLAAIAGVIVVGLALYGAYRATERLPKRERLIVGALTLTAVLLALRKRLARPKQIVDEGKGDPVIVPSLDQGKRAKQDADITTSDDVVRDATRGESDDSRALRAWARGGDDRGEP